ncbi:MAG: UDP-3-O-(3-hydroxymyristoyl)glucosamine N-acyltransferase [Nitrospirae bacterium]|nr:UDP-3-O-(3-hydroxymyristoyl)glucosamine N-acyltransferase [Nitrospirota bacterium]
MTQTNTINTTLREISGLIDGQIYGDSSTEITSVCGIAEAVTGCITYVEAHYDMSLLNQLKSSKASAVIVAAQIYDLKLPQIVTVDPVLSYIKLLNHFYVKNHPAKGVMNGAILNDDIHLGDDISIYPNVYISKNVSIGDRSILYPGTFIGENSSIGSDCVIYANVTINDNVQVGDRVRIHPNSVIGADGFGYVFIEGQHVKKPQIGGVLIDDDVEIGANVTIDRAATGNTIIGKGSKIDNLVQIAHNVKIGKFVIVVAQAGIAGSSIIGDRTIIAAQAGIPDHINIEPDSFIGPQSGVMKDLKSGKYLGSPAIPYRDFIKRESILKRLPEIVKKIDDIEKKSDKIYNK